MFDYSRRNKFLLNLQPIVMAIQKTGIRRCQIRCQGITVSQGVLDLLIVIRNGKIAWKHWPFC